MTNIDVDRSVSPTLRTRSAGQTVMQKCLALQDDAPQRGRLARALGHSPLHPDAVAWYDDALAELETGRRLAGLATSAPGYTVLHSLPIGDGEGALHTDVEHLVIGRSGVFCLTSTRSTTLTDAQLEAVAVEARQVSKHLSRTLQRVIPVTPLLVTVGGAQPKTALALGKSALSKPAPGKSAPAKSAPARQAEVEVVPARELAGWFAKRGPVLTTAELATVALAAEQPETWHVPADALANEAAIDDFSELQSAVDAASDRERVALSVAAAVAVIVMLVSATLIVTSVSGLLRLAGL
jgi:hypothetical protein